MESPELFEVPGYLYRGKIIWRLALRFALLIPGARVYTWSGTRNVSKSQSLYGESSEFFQVQGPLYKEKGVRPSSSQSHISLHIFHIFFIFSSYFFISSTYFFVFPTYFHIYKDVAARNFSISHGLCVGVGEGRQTRGFPTVAGGSCLKKSLMTP